MKEVSIKEKKHHTRRLSIKEGIFYSFRASLGDQYLAPFAIALQASNSIVAIITSLFNLSLIGQLFGSKLVSKKSRKSIMIKTTLIEALGWFLIALISYLFYKQILVSVLPLFLIIATSLFLISMGIGKPAWFSWMGDLVDSKYRGRWFSKRNAIIYFSIAFLSICGALILEYFKKTKNPEIGFIILFSIAFLARLNCARIFKKHYEPELKIKNNKDYSLRIFIKELKKSNFGKFSLFRFMLAFAVTLTAPLVSVYLLRYLELDYITYITINLSGVLFSIITLNLWGKISDKYGNYKVISLTTFLIPLTPLLWILSANKIYLFLVPAIIGGTSWTAFLMASNNFIYDNISKEKRAKASSYFNLIAGVGAILGGFTSALLIEVVNTSFIEPLFFIFLIGTFARMIIVGFWVPKLKEIKKKKKIKNLRQLEKLMASQVKPSLIEGMHEIQSIPHYLKER